MSEGRSALVAGATGLVGSALTRRLLRDGGWNRVVTVGRRPTGLEGTRLDDRVLDPLDPEALGSFDPGPVDVAFCCLGTTIRTAGSKEAFRRVDRDLVVSFAEAARRIGAEHLAVVSSVGADPGATAFYSRVKGEMETAVRRVGFASLNLVRPSLLVGDREESRPAEKWTIRLSRPLAPLMVGPLARFRPIRVEDVAAALIAAAREAPDGERVLEGEDLRRFAAAGRP